MTEVVILARSGSLRHANPIKNALGDRAVIVGEWRADRVLQHKPELLITFDEFHAELTLCVIRAVDAGVPVLLVRDGILEWRMVWENPAERSMRHMAQPFLSDKVACLGRLDARIIESWGNLGKCEVVGVPRFDPLVAQGKAPRKGPVAGRFRLLVMTAKTPGFTPEQVETTIRSLHDLWDVCKGRKDIEVVWRLTQDLHHELGVRNKLQDVLGTELWGVLDSVDAVITTPSTAMLEGMLFGLPVALLDYHNCPHYVPAAWRITAREQIEDVLEGLRMAPEPRMLHQEFLLHEALACRSPALDRMLRLIEEMIAAKRDGGGSGTSGLRFPARLVPAEMGGVHDDFEAEAQLPSKTRVGTASVDLLREELRAARQTIKLLQEKVDILSHRLGSIPGYRLAKRIRKWFRRKI